MTTLKERFQTARCEYEMSPEARELMTNHAAGFGGAELIYKYYRRFVLSFCHQELLALATEIETKMVDSSSVVNGEIFNLGICEAANMIRSKANELN